MAEITGLDHIAIVTTQLDKDVAFYRDCLGITCTHTEILPDRGIRVAFLPIGQTRIELIEPMHDKSEVSSFLQKRGPGIHHMALRSSDVDQSAAKLESLKVPLAQKPTGGAHNSRVCFIHPKASSGVLIELMTPA